MISIFEDTEKSWIPGPVLIPYTKLSENSMDLNYTLSQFFSEIRDRTLVQVVCRQKNRPLIGLEACFLGHGTTFTKCPRLDSQKKLTLVNKYVI